MYKVWSQYKLVNNKIFSRNLRRREKFARINRERQKK